MPARKLYFRFVETNTRGLVTLNETHAPQTCDALWNALATPVHITCDAQLFCIA